MPQVCTDLAELMATPFSVLPTSSATHLQLQGFIEKFFLGGRKYVDPGYKKIIPSQAMGLGGAISPPVGSRGKPPGSEKQYSASASV